MSGTRRGGLKTAKKLLVKYRVNFYSLIGQKGGSVKGIKKGFAVNPELARAAGKKSKRGLAKKGVPKKREPWWL